jgi:hypothetical protein
MHRLVRQPFIPAVGLHPEAVKSRQSLRRAKPDESMRVRHDLVDSIARKTVGR